MPIDGTLIQARVNKGYAIAAAKTGLLHEHYRPTDPAPPLRLLNRVGVLPATFDAKPSYNFRIPALHKDAMRYALVDGDKVRPGDYLVGPAGTFFIAAQPPLQPVVCVECNAVLTLRRLVVPAGFGAIANRGEVAGGEDAIFSAWPGSLRYASRGRGDTVELPGDAPPPWFAVLLPAVPGAEPPRAGDILADEQGRRYAVTWCEVSSLGWRMEAQHQVTA